MKLNAMCFVVAMLLMIPVLGVSAQGVDDFLVPAKGGTSDVKQPAKVVEKDDPKLGQKVIHAATPQDAANAAVKQQKAKALKEVKHAGGGLQEIPGGASFIKMKSGTGIVASGFGTYKTNITSKITQRVAQRTAYVKAYLRAQQALTEFVHGLTTKAKQSLGAEQKNIDSDKSSLTNMSESTSSEITTTTAGILRGYVLYECSDNPSNGLVMVSLMSTPRSRGQTQRVGQRYMMAQDIRKGISEVLATVRSGLVPPVGGRTVVVPSTGEVAWVAFGCAVVRGDPDRMPQMLIHARTFARVRAQASLTGIIRGTMVAAATQVKDRSYEVQQQFEKGAKNADNSKADGGKMIKKLEQARTTVMYESSVKEAIQSIISGKLPPGVQIKYYMSKDKGWVWAVAFYMPSLTEAAKKTQRDILNANIVLTDDQLEKLRSKNKKGTFKQGPTGKLDEN